LDIVENAEKVQRYTKGLSEQSLAADEKTRDAVERCLQRISEAAIRLGEVEAARSRQISHGRTFAESEIICAMGTIPSTLA
jgi:uncharacterized protein with HEPN domain